MQRLSKRFDDDLVFFALTIYGEARGECLEGQVAVAYVIRHRLEKWNRYSSYKNTVLDRLQFSCWNRYRIGYGFISPYDHNTKVLRKAFENFDGMFDNHKILRQCVHVADGVMNDMFLDYSNGADHYLAKWLYESDACPSWAKKYKVTTTIGNHIFLRSFMMER